MSNEKFTPGPWLISRHGQIEFKTNNGSMSPVLFKGVTTAMTRNREADSNSHLISQAPAMYEMLEDLSTKLPDKLTAEYYEIIGLLAKARGES